ncbi:MAG: mercuric transport protein MerTP [Balneolaceae bacterium]|nr:mercuric transport protein MerTP [Balneolaceae bacterium]
MKNEKQSKNDKTLLSAGLGIAFIASLCCITPVFAFLAGIGGIASVFSWMEPVRPYLIGLTVLLLVFAWYQKLKPRTQEEIECACEEDEKPSFWQSKAFLGVVTVISVLLLAFPYYSNAFFPDSDQQEVVYVTPDQVETVTFNIEGMTCAGCEATVDNAARTVDGVVEVKASYKEHSAEITYLKDKTTRATIIAAINKTGFTVDEDKTQN